MSVNEEFLDDSKSFIEWKLSFVIQMMTEKPESEDYYEYKKKVIDLFSSEILQHFQQEQESKTLKQGFYAGQANAGIKLDECHKNWKEWSGYMLRKVKQQDSNKSG